MRQNKNQIHLRNSFEKIPYRQPRYEFHNQSPEDEEEQYESAVRQKGAINRPDEFYRIQGVEGIEHNAS